MVGSRKPVPVQERLGRLRWPVVGRLGLHPSGDERSRGRGPGLEYAGAREYTAGDDPRQIDWNLTARSGRTFVREAHPDRGLDAWLILDTSRSLDWGTSRCLKREAAAELVVAAATLLARRGNRVGALIFDRNLKSVIPPAAGRRARATLLAQVLGSHEAGEDGVTDLTTALVQAVRLIRRPSLVVVVSDFMAPSGWQAPLKVLGLRHEVVAAVISDPREDDIPDIGVVTFEDPETRAQLNVDTGDSRLRERFRLAAQARRRGLRSELITARAMQLEISTAEDAVAQLVRFFHHIAAGVRGRPGEASN